MYFSGVTDQVAEIVDEAYAQAILARLRAGVVIARTAVNYLTPTTLSEAFLSTPIGLLIRWASPDYAETLLSDHKRAALKAISDASKLIDQLAGPWYLAAKTGVPAWDGTDTWVEWRRKASIIAESLKAYIDYQTDVNVGINLLRFIADFVITTVDCATNPAECLCIRDPSKCLPDVRPPWWVWAGAAGAALIGGAYVFNTFAPRRR